MYCKRLKSVLPSLINEDQTTFYKDMKSSVTVNGQLSQRFDIQRGCRLGDPISPYLFILCVEIFAIMIRQNKHIRGIFIGETE